MIHEREGTPTVTLDSDQITQEMAARLTIALLGQILYMKGQVPFPIASLSRMVDRQVAENTSRAAIRAEKRRTEFLESYDDLTSHLRTTFVALSTALAKNETKYPLCSALTSTYSTSTQQNPSDTFPKTHREVAKVHILLVLGPLPSAAKARYLLELDGFRVEQFGEWRYSYCAYDHVEQEQCSSESEDELVESTESVSSPRLSSLPTTPRRLFSEHGDWDSCSSSSRGSYDPGSVPSSPSVASSETLSDDEELLKRRTSLSKEVNPLVYEQYEDASLRSAERLLFRALFASDEGLGFGDEILPTQAHVLIRAPRRFAHPTWIPRQSWGSMLDRQVQCFLESESRLSGTKTKGIRNHAGFGVGLRTVGVRVKCEDKVAEVKSLKVNSKRQDIENKCENEEDELIWWSWDGKLVGFSD